jgi:DNA-binding PadR family transcriptional regulator
MKELTISEEILLSAIWRLKEEAYGVSIRKKVAEVTKKNLIYGTLYNSLDQLVKKGYVTKTKGEPTRQRGGRSKIYYELTKPGIRALQAARELQNSIWEDLPELAAD